MAENVGMEERRQSGSGGAEAVLDLQPGCSVPVSYHPLFGPHEDLFLLELDGKLLPDFFHHSVTLRGLPDEDAVLCTKSKTYAVKFVGTSNSVFLIPPSDCSGFHGDLQDPVAKENSKPHVSIIKAAPGNMELVEVAPRLEKLKRLLLENPYRACEASVMDEPEHNEERGKGLYTWNNLVNLVQASDDELLSGLHTLSAVEIDGYWRIVDENYMDMILRMLLHNSVLNDWSLDALDEEDVVTVLVSDEFPHKLALHCLHIYGTKVNDGTGKSLWKLEPRRVCLHFARKVLGDEKMRLENFMQEWRQKIPEGMEANFEMLEGEVLTEKLGIETRVYAFSVRSLPSTPAERFSSLFKHRPKWEWKELEPYIRDLNIPGLSLEGLLLKYTRRTQPTADAEPVFSAR
ncbi:PREDICTED: sister chromatid cohesion protein DCC1 [Tarenaya hassleriana]|uniref:sister chromatid cohesion protein DCC1 n=1 Tax=Tarenaya hassleriana TaxID=28532 RepID=UPI00053C2748|nr:PREDICTED: sister chromatid cohesion protein DCC1 [Tarenaya hassleriana]